MANDAVFDSYGKSKPDFLDHKMGKVDDFNDVSGGGSHVDAYGNDEKKAKGLPNMNAAEAFSKKKLTEIDAMGTEAPCAKGQPGQFSSNTGDHFKVSTYEVDPMGTDCGKSKSGQSSKRSG